MGNQVTACGLAELEVELLLDVNTGAWFRCAADMRLSLAESSSGAGFEVKSQHYHTFIICQELKGLDLQGRS